MDRRPYNTKSGIKLECQFLFTANVKILICHTYIDATLAVLVVTSRVKRWRSGNISSMGRLVEQKYPTRADNNAIQFGKHFIAACFDSRWLLKVNR